MPHYNRRAFGGHSALRSAVDDASMVTDLIADDIIETPDAESGGKGASIRWLDEDLGKLSLLKERPEFPKMKELDGALLAKKTAAIVADSKKAYNLLPREDFVTRGGVCIGDTALCDWTAEYVSGGEGWAPGKMKGVRGVATEVHCTGEHDDTQSVWGFFERGILGSGQMASNTFPVTFPDSYPIAKLAGVSCRVTCLVKNICYKVEKKDVAEISEDEARSIAAKAMEEQSRRAWLSEVDDAIMSEVMSKFCSVSTKKVEESVSWAKFGPKRCVTSKRDF